MNQKLKNQRCLIAIISLVVAGAATAQAQSDFVLMPPLRGGTGTNQAPLVRARLDTSYTAAGQAKYQGANRGDSDAFSVGLGVSGVVPINDRWMVPLDLLSQNDWLESVPGTPVPTHLNTLGLGAGLGYRASEDWLVVGRISPSLYRFSSVDSDDVGWAGGVTALWRYSSTFQFMFGFLAAPDSDVPVLPMVGANWRINDQWDLRVMFPQPRLTYVADDHWRLYAGADITGTTFRTTDTLGTELGQSRYNDALGTYRDVRLGAGVGYQFCRNLRAEVEGGYSVWRQIDYKDIDQTVKFDPAPYVRVGVNVSF
jgi:hypothetical protein